MTNMSYCRFQNTLGDLLDCQQHIDDDLSADEHAAMLDLVAVCREISAENGRRDDSQ